MILKWADLFVICNCYESAVQTNVIGRLIQDVWPSKKIEAVRIDFYLIC